VWGLSGGNGSGGNGSSGGSGNGSGSSGIGSSGNGSSCSSGSTHNACNGASGSISGTSPSAPIGCNGGAFLDSIPSMDLVSLTGSSLSREANCRQVGSNGVVVQHLEQLYEAANAMQPHFEQTMLTIAEMNSLALVTTATTSAITAATTASTTATTTTASTSPTNQSGLFIGDIKSLARVAEKIREKYLHVHPGPACSWVFDMLRASFVCKTQDQILRVYEAIKREPNCKIIRVKNRFQKPTAAGFRDILMNVLISCPAPAPAAGSDSYFDSGSGSAAAAAAGAGGDAGGSGGGASATTLRFVCEVQITHVDLRHYEIKHNTRALYHMFWPLLRGSAGDREKKLEIISRIVSLITPIMKSFVPDCSVDALKKRYTQVRDIVTKHYDKIHISEDIEALRNWGPVLEAINDLPLAESNQRKVVKLVRQTHGDNSLALASEYIRLGHLLQLRKKYTNAFEALERGVRTLGETLGENTGVVADTLLRLAEIKLLNGELADGIDLHTEVDIIRKRIFSKEPSSLIENTVIVQSTSGLNYYENDVPASAPAAAVGSGSSIGIGLITRQHSETHHSAYDTAPENYSNYNTYHPQHPHEELEPVPDLWDLVSSSGSDFGGDDA
jgi:hypothetical protein